MEQVWGWDEEEQLRLHEDRFNHQDFRIIEISGEPVGTMALVQDDGWLKVNQIFILPSHQSKGIGEECMRKVIADAKEKRLPVRLRVLKNNLRAQSFYRRIGFRVTGKSDTHISMELWNQ